MDGRRLEPLVVHARNKLLIAFEAVSRHGKRLAEKIREGEAILGEKRVVAANPKAQMCCVHLVEDEIAACGGDEQAAVIATLPNEALAVVIGHFDECELHLRAALAKRLLEVVADEADNAQ